jgi:TonB family protein
MTLGAASAPGGRRRLWLMLGLLGVVAAAGVAGYAYFARAPRSTPPVTLSPEAVAAQARVRELEARIAQLEREKTEAETAAADDARRKLEAQAAVRGRAVDPAAVQRAEEEARRRARAEQERNQQDELARLASEKRAEEQRLAEASPPPSPTPTPAAVTAPTPTPTPVFSPTAEMPPATGVPAGPGGGAVPPVTTAPAPVPEAAPRATPAPTPTPTLTPAAPVRRGTLVDVNDPTVKPPVLLRQPAVAYPEMARQARIEGDVELKALIDENGNVLQVTLVRTTRPGYRFELEAERHVRARRYRPATKDGVNVRVWLPILVKFTSTR